MRPALAIEMVEPYRGDSESTPARSSTQGGKAATSPAPGVANPQGLLASRPNVLEFSL